MNQVVQLETLSKIIVTKNCGDVVTVSMKNTSVIVTKLNNIVNIKNCGS